MASSSSWNMPFVICLMLMITNGSHARESHFFSKVTKDNTETPAAATVTAASSTNVEVQKQNSTDSNEPTFVPELAGDSYGLYGHDSSSSRETQTQLAATDAYGNPYKTAAAKNPMDEFTSTADNDETEKTTVQFSGNDDSSSSSSSSSSEDNESSSSSLYNNNNYNGESLYSNGKSVYSSGDGESSVYSKNYNYGQDQHRTTTYEPYNNNNNNYYNKDSYVTDEERLAGSGGVTYTTSGDDSVNSGGALLDKSYTNSKKQQQQERQGLSDTRFMEGGKYFYDINDEQKYYPTYRYENSRSSSANINGGRYYSQNNANGRSYNPNNYNDNTNNYAFNNNNAVDNTESYGQQNQQEFEEVQGELQP